MKKGVTIKIDCQFCFQINFKYFFLHCPTIPNTIQLKINFNRNAIMHYATLFIDHASYSYTPDYNIFKKINFF